MRGGRGARNLHPFNVSAFPMTAPITSFFPAVWRIKSVEFISVADMINSELHWSVIISAAVWSTNHDDLCSVEHKPRWAQTVWPFSSSCMKQKPSAIVNLLLLLDRGAQTNSCDLLLLLHRGARSIASCGWWSRLML